MNTPKIEQKYSTGIGDDRGERGTAIVIALFVLALIGVFVALALSRTASEAAGVGNETSEARTLYAAQGGLETMTRNFNKIFETKLNPTLADRALVENPDVVPGLSKALGGDYTFDQELLCAWGTNPDCAVVVSAAESTVILSDEDYSGLYAIRDNWRLQSTATAPDGTQLMLTRNILNNRIPIFQFGIFYDDDLELFPGPQFAFGGRVHSNGHFFIAPDTGIYFDSRVTASGHIITQAMRNGDTSRAGRDRTFIKDAARVDQRLYPAHGSVLNGTPSVLPPDLPPSVLNPNFLTQSEIFDGNLRSEADELNLPLKVGRNTDLIEMIKRGKKAAVGGVGGDLVWNGTAVVPVETPSNPPDNADADDERMTQERFSNKTGIRVSLSDSKAKLPGCATGVGTAAVTGICGIRLDGKFDGLGLGPDTGSATLAERSRGYQPRPIAGYQATRVNGERLFTGREAWIKIERVRTNPVTRAIETEDITADILSLGVTEAAPVGLIPAYTGTSANNGTPTSPSGNLLAAGSQTPSTYPDSRSIIKIQRFTIPGGAVPGNSNVLTSPTGNNVVMRFTNTNDTKVSAGCPTTGPTPCTAEDTGPVNERYGHLKRATVGASANPAIVPFPIEMFDTREGMYFDQATTTYYPNLNRVPRNGVMSMIDIDVANLRRFLRGDFDGTFPTDTYFATEFNGGNGLRGSDIPELEGWVLYVSDRRGDANFDGEFDMENVYQLALETIASPQPGEDLDGPTTGPPHFVPRLGAGALEAKYVADDPIFGETERYNVNAALPDTAAVTDHRYFRRGVRLINGTVVPGIYDATVPSNTRGFTVASENAVYVKGNYNATHVTSIPATGNTPFNNYRPFNDPTHIPAAVVADAVIILSNNWDDAKSFISPYDRSQRVAEETTMRFALISGDTITARIGSPSQSPPSGDRQLNGGVHNFKRFLESWGGGISLNYNGSLINLYNSRNNNGTFKCCNHVYQPPNRNWVFDSTFLDPGRLPPGTPFFQYVQTTGFQRSTD